MIRLNKEQHEYVLKLLDDNLKNRIVDVLRVENDDCIYNADEDLELDFYDFLQDKQVEIGFDKEYNLNVDGEMLGKLIDEVYNQIEE